MKPINFDYVRARSLAEACAALAEAGEDGKIIAGGQTLVPLLAMRLARPRLVVDINGIAELQGIETHSEAVIIRACTRQAVALADDRVRRHVPLLAKALRFVGHVQTRHRGTIGGSLANADPAAEIGVAATALGATLTSSSTGGERPIAIAQFFRGAMETALAAEECLSAASFPVWRDGHIGTGFQEVSARRSDFALAAAAAQLAINDDGTCRRATLAIGGAGAMPRLLEAAAQRLVGTKLANADLADAAAIAETAITTSGDTQGSALYRRRIAGEMARRALSEARDELAGHA